MIITETGGPLVASCDSCHDGKNLPRLTKRQKKSHKHQRDAVEK